MQDQSLKVLECHSKDIIFYSAGTSQMEEKKDQLKQMLAIKGITERNSMIRCVPRDIFVGALETKFL